jgi:hypothetical protein
MMLAARVVDSGMAQPSFKELEIQIDQCMIADRFRLRRDINKKHQRSRVVASIQKSCELAGKQKSSVPVVTYPEALILRYVLYAAIPCVSSLTSLIEMSSRCHPDLTIL